MDLTNCKEPDCTICYVDDYEPEEQICLTNHSFDDEGFLKSYIEIDE